jgi:hypothetical protein
MKNHRWTRQLPFRCLPQSGRTYRYCVDCGAENFFNRGELTYRAWPKHFFRGWGRHPAVQIPPTPVCRGLPANYDPPIGA